MNDITLNQDLLDSLKCGEDGKVTNADNFDSWTPIKGENGYSGNFDGKNHAIRGVFCNDGADYVGLFGVVSAGKISNVRVEDSYFYGYGVGGICGTNKSSSTSDADIKNCSVDGMVKGYENVGGICGYNEKGTIENCSKEGTVIGSGKIGGICGKSAGKVVTCQNMGAVEGEDNVGGVCGINRGEIITSQNMGAVEGNVYVGGVCGENVNGKITTSQNMGTVEGEGNVGGVCGENVDGKITTSQNMGAVEGNNVVGGVCGANAGGNGCTTDCQNTGEVKGNNVVGGICGINSFSEIVNCCSTGKVIKKEAAEGDPGSEDPDEIGAVVGEVHSASEKNCYFNSDVCSQPAIGFVSNVENSIVENVCSKSALAFAGGEVCYLLNNKRTEGTATEPLNWYQNLDIPGEAQDPLPVLDWTHGRVYYVEAECFKGYSNDPDKKHRLEYAADDEADRITVSCRDCKETLGALCLRAPEGNLWHDGKAKEAVVENTVSGAAVSTPAITYKTKDGSVLEAAPVEAGTYTASISLMDAKGAEYSVSVEYTIRRESSSSGSSSSGGSGGGSGSSDSAGQPGTGTAQAGSKTETTITTNPDGSRTETTITANPDGSRTETAVTTRTDGSRTESTVTTGADGSRTESTVTTGADGSRTESTVTTGADGNRTESTVTTGADGSRTESMKTEDKAAGTTVVEEKTKAADGTTSEKKTETRKDGSVTETFTETKPDGSTTKITTKTDAEGVEKSTAVAKDTSTGNVLTVTKTVESSGSVKKTSAVLVTKEKTITKSDADEAEALAGKTNVPITVKIKDKKGNLLYKVKVNTKDIKADSALFVYRYDEKTKTYHLVKKNSQNAKADEEGNIRLDLEKGKSSQRYELAGKKQAAAIEKKILAGIKPKNPSRKISMDEAAAFKMARGFDMEDVKTIRYASRDSSVAAIDKNGKITAKKPGKTVVTAEITLKNGKTKTVKMTVEVTE